VSATAGADLQRAALRGQLAAVADASGRFRIAGLEAGPFRLRTAWPGSAPGTIWQTAGVLVSAPSSGVKLVADAPGRVHGGVVFGSGGSPTIFSVGLPLAASTTFIETNGAFVLHDVPAGHHSVVFSSPEFVTKSIEGVSVPPAGDADIGTISVDSGRAVSGYVLDTGGRPIPGARVGGGQILIADGVEVGGHGDFPDWMGMLKTTSGDDGRFLLNGIPRDPFLVVAEADEGRSQFTRVAGGDESVELNLRLEPPGSVQGRVSRGGQRAPDAVVSATPQGVAGSHLIVRSAMDGSYKLDKLAPGTYLLTATIAAAGSATSTTVPLSVVAGERSHVDLNIQAGSVTLHVSAPKPDVTAQVLLLAFRGDLPVRTVAELQAFLADHGSPSSRTGLIAQGNEAVLVDVTPGQYQLCHVVLSAGDLANREVLENLQRNAGKLPVSCQPLQVPDGAPDYGVSVTL
jgi:hypothetical protein